MSVIEIYNKSFENACFLCGDEVYELSEKINLRCDFCNKVSLAGSQCQNEHYICNECINMPVNEFVKLTCLKYKGIDPMELAQEIMNSPMVKMHGAEHHFIVPAVMLTVTLNYQKKTDNLEVLLQIAEQRAKNETPNQCSYTLGTCGAALGSGVFLSIFEGQTLETDDEWSMKHALVAKSIKNIADSGGPRCCKRDTYLTIESTIEYLEEKFALSLPYNMAKCTFSLRNRSCKKEECNFYNMSNSLV